MRSLKKLKPDYGWIAYLFILPTIIMIGLYSLYPLLYNVFLSFFRWNIADPTMSPIFTGLGNYISMFTDENFLIALRNTFILSAITLALEFIVALGFAVLLSQELRVNNLFRALFLIPLAVAPIAAGYLWRMMLNPANGLINYLLNIFNISSIPWVSQKLTAWVAIILTNNWMRTPIATIIFVAALKAVPKGISEAAEVDGANRWQLFWKITFPIITPVVIITMLIRLMDSFKIYAIIVALTRGGPGVSTENLNMYIYKTGLKYFNAGKSATGTVIFILIIFILGFYTIRRIISSND